MLRLIFSSNENQCIFVKKNTLEGIEVNAKDCFVFWGHTVPFEILKIANQHKVKILRLEDGFIRSVGLGSDLIPPLSLVADQSGMYFDSSKPSDLEELLQRHSFSNNELSRAKEVHRMIVRNKITKYNIEPNRTVSWNTLNKVAVLVVGQVENDASILAGAKGRVRTNLELLKAAHEMHPDAFIVYKPHPDVHMNNRKGYINPKQIYLYANHTEINASIISCIEASDFIHTITSLSGFDGLLRQKKVFVHGDPFYAGWGLTIDLGLSEQCRQRRTRKLSITELIAGALIKYPLYWDWNTKKITTCEATVLSITKYSRNIHLDINRSRSRIIFLKRKFNKFMMLFKIYLGHL
ncbi:hypothetical protein [Polynucleobacter sp.]|jgi:capsular polysaccharide export protein|uniref:capsular polysaccharide export protein, LipB/KpsS family n=1 Tax=Polynucleobacter sp. TaxID=2029855 RepID=UPI0027357662|nr:hypothetical protein [Polynucleobacter sp.]MDP3122555.1 hypothetical protein [Polynucleobacter sp.]